MTSEKFDFRQITSEEMAELARCMKDFDYWMEKYVYILDSNKKCKLKWMHWPCHRKVINTIEDNQLTIILKSRQLGISWLMVAYALWMSMYQYGTRVALFSKGEKEAGRLLDRGKYIYKYLPPFLRSDTIKANESEMEFEIDSGIYVYPATADAGRSESASLVIDDEWAFHPFAESQYTAIKPIIDAGGKFVGLSTANGAGTFYHSTWIKAESGDNNFAPLFLGWRERPDRDDAWYEKQKKEYPIAMLHQEYPDTPEEAFIQRGTPVFDAEYLEVRARFHKPMMWEMMPDNLKLDTKIEVYQLPREGTKYTMGVDVAEGEGIDKGDPDFSCVTVIDEQNVEVLSLRGRWDVFKTAEMVHKLALEYPGVVGIERNGLGIAVIKKCEELGTPGLYRESPILQKLGEALRPGKHGWITTPSSKPMIIMQLEEHLRQGWHQVASPGFLDEARVYQNLGGGQFGAPPGFHDDRVMARAIAIEMRKHMDQAPSMGPRVIHHGAALRVAA
jgi:hypothetical protein